jgi:hypothetical protein
VGLVVMSLLAVVLGHAVLAQGQLHLSSLQAQLAAEQAKHRRQLLAVTQLETPSRIVSQAEQQLHMVPPQQVTQLPSVPLDTPVSASSTTVPGNAATTPSTTSAPTPPSHTNAGTTPTTTTPTTSKPTTGRPSTGR